MRKIISVLLAMSIILTMGVIGVSAQEVPDYSKMDDYIDINVNPIVEGASAFVENPFTVVNGYEVTDGEEKGYNVITDDGTITLTNNAPSDKYVMYLTFIPLYPNGDGTYSNWSGDYENDYPSYYYYEGEGDYNDAPVNPLLEEDIVKIFVGESVTFSIPDTFTWRDDVTVFDKDIIWAVVVDTNHGEYKTINGEYGEYKEFVPTVEDDYGWLNWWYVKIDDEAVNKINSEHEKSDAAHSGNIFNDVKYTDYYFNPVVWAIDKEITTGTSETTFSPNDTCTQAQILTFLWRANGSLIVEGKYDWIDDNSYYANALKWAYKERLIDETINPDAPCARIDVVKYLYELTDLEDYPTESADVMTDLNGYGRESVAWAINGGITMGTSETTFSPKDTCTRGQIVTFLYRAYANVE